MEIVTSGQADLQTKPKGHPRLKLKSIRGNPGLCKNEASGIYYGRAWINGRSRVFSLKTESSTEAKAKLPFYRKRLEDEGKPLPDAEPLPPPPVLFKALADEYMKAFMRDPKHKRKTLKYKETCMKKIRAAWPDIDATPIKAITAKHCDAFMAGILNTLSANYHNNILATLQAIFALAIEQEEITTNPAAKVPRARVKATPPVLPSPAEFTAFLHELGNSGRQNAPHYVTTAKFLAYTGCRAMEAANVTWADVNLDAGKLVVRGDPKEGTKNGQIRHVPLVPQALELLRSLRAERANEPLIERVLLICDIEKPMTAAAAKVGMERITHHDLRHLFATRCIEAGTDIPTVANWLGHRDGGALLLRTYSHLRDSHSKEQAAKIRFPE